MSRNQQRSRSRAGRAGVVIGIFCAGGLACGRSTVLYEGDAFGSDVPSLGVGGGGGRGGSLGQSGRTTGGTGGSVNTGGSFTTGGTTPGAGGSSAGTSSVSGAGGATQGPYACSAVKATCNAFHEFPVSSAVSWGSGAFTGGITVWGPGLVRDMDTSRLHVTGTVSGYAGIVFWFSRCSDLSPATGVQMTLSGSAGQNRPITFQAMTNSDYPWQPWPEDGKGACTSPDALDPFTYCQAPDVTFQITNSPLFIAWDTLGSGTPVPWNPVSSPGEIVGLQWVFWWDPNTATPYDVDFSIDDVLLVTGSGDVECVTRMGGSGGMGGAGGGATAGAAGTVTTGGFGGAGGSGGSGGSGQGGFGNEGGVAGEAGVGGDSGTSSGGASDAGFGGI